MFIVADLGLLNVTLTLFTKLRGTLKHSALIRANTVIGIIV